jgi:hypothetical protein
MAQQSWESIPGRTTGHLPEMADADPKVLEAFHKEIVGAMTDAEGRDLINQHFGLLTGRTFDAPGAFEGGVFPGSQSPAAVAPAKGTAPTTIDPASKELIDWAAYTRALVLQQDAVGWNRPVYRASTPKYMRNGAREQQPAPVTADRLPGDHRADGVRARQPAGRAAGARPRLGRARP